MGKMNLEIQEIPFLYRIWGEIEIEMRGEVDLEINLQWREMLLDYSK